MTQSLLQLLPGEAGDGERQDSQYNVIQITGQESN